MKDQSSHESSIEISPDVNLVSVGELFEHTQDVFNLIALRAFEIFESPWMCTRKRPRGLVSSGIGATHACEVPPLGIWRTAYRTRRSSWIPQAGDQGKSRAAPTEHQRKNRAPRKPQNLKSTPIRIGTRN